MNQKVYDTNEYRCLFKQASMILYVDRDVR